MEKEEADVGGGGDLGGGVRSFLDSLLLFLTTWRGWMSG